MLSGRNHECDKLMFGKLDAGGAPGCYTLFSSLSGSALDMAVMGSAGSSQLLVLSVDLRSDRLPSLLSAIYTSGRGTEEQSLEDPGILPCVTK